ncbi:element excision factor XisI family protein [Nostoc punctiforme UO1]|uniref:element excision factor XisI family protein n=1 Tax=Nostoc punctiforme TaxID=272131 RepID=UPI0030A0F6FB
MEGINNSQIVQDILSNHSANDVANGTEAQLLFDAERHHYQVLNFGWKEQRKIYGVIIHVDIKDKKIGYKEMVHKSVLLMN